MPTDELDALLKQALDGLDAAEAWLSDAIEWAQKRSSSHAEEIERFHQIVQVLLDDADDLLRRVRKENA